METALLGSRAVMCVIVPEEFQSHCVGSDSEQTKSPELSRSVQVDTTDFGDGYLDM